MDQQKGMDAGTMFSVANFIVLKRIKQALGLDQCFAFLFGAAPLKKTSIEYFASLDMPLHNMYGLSETSAAATSSYYYQFSLEHAGMPLSGTHIKIANPDENGQGEIQIYGRHIMMGYLKNETATKECIDEHGYFKSGDLGRLDEGKWLKITGRIKELIIGAGGENVAPVPIEDAFKKYCPACSNIMIVGEQRRFMSALITFKVEIDMKTGIPSTELTKDAAKFLKDASGVDVKTSDEACKNQKVFECIQKCVNETNKTLVSRAAHIKKFALISTDFSLPGGELTPTMKLKRKITEKKYNDIVEQIYAVTAKI
jgi:long-chain-fatty-acid--CoA ligase ACSBG